MGSNGKSSPGFTLLELLVALAIAAFALSLLSTFLSGSGSSAELRQATRNIIAGLRQSQSKAIVGNSETAFALNVERRSYRIGAAGPEQPLGEGIALELLTARSERNDGQSGNIRFYPDGGSSGGEIRLSRGGNSHLVTIDWLTGAVKLAE